MARIIRTTKGDRDESTLRRIVGFEDRPETYAVWVEWWLEGELVRRDAHPVTKELGPLVFTTNGDVPIETLARTIELTDGPLDIAVAVVWRAGDAIVRRDAQVIVKEPSVVADAIAAAIGG